MTDRLRAAAEAGLEALINGKNVRAGEGGTKHQPTMEDAAIKQLRAALADAEDDAWELDYEVRVNTGYGEMWVAGANDVKEALYYAAQYVEEGTVRVYERRMKVIATLEARHD